MSTKVNTASERFFIDHETIHDRITGRHVTTDPCFGPLGRDQLWELLLSLESDKKQLRDALKEARELCALMAEGEGGDPEVYMSMAQQAMEKLDRLAKKL